MLVEGADIDDVRTDRAAFARRDRLILSPDVSVLRFVSVILILQPLGGWRHKSAIRLSVPSDSYMIAPCNAKLS